MNKKVENNKKNQDLDFLLSIIKGYCKKEYLLSSYIITMIIFIIFNLYRFIITRDINSQLIKDVTIYSIFIACSYLILYFSNKKIIPFLERGKEGFKKGEIWFFRKLSLETPIKILRMFRSIYHGLFFILIIIFTLNFIYLLIFLISTIIVIITLFIQPANIMVFAIMIILINLDIALMLIIIAFSEKSYMHEKTLLLFLFNKFDCLNKDDREKYIQKILIFIEKYSLPSNYTSKKFFGKKINECISLYYKNIAIPLLGKEVIEKRLFPEFKKLLLNEDYEGLIIHLDKINKLCSKKRGYALHKCIIKTLNQEIQEKDLIEFSLKLKKIKIKGGDEENKFKKFIEKIEWFLNTKIAIVLVAIIVLVTLSILVYRGVIDIQQIIWIKNLLS